ncbi:hypothetical protein ACFL6P_09995, partial [Candidatus Latescibacterota bacterium]
MYKLTTVTFRNSFLVLLCIAGASMLSGCGKYEEKPFLWEAGTRNITWGPLAETVKISRSTEVVFLKDSESSLRITGTGGEAGFAESTLHPMKEFEIYTVTAGVKVDEDQPENSVPSITCQFLTSDPNSFLGAVTLTHAKKFYSSEELGKWDIQNAQFRAPLGTEQFRLTVVQNS